MWQRGQSLLYTFTSTCFGEVCCLRLPCCWACCLARCWASRPNRSRWCCWACCGRGNAIDVSSISLFWWSLLESHSSCTSLLRLNTHNSMTIIPSASENVCWWGLTSPQNGCEVLWWVRLSVCLSAQVSWKPHGWTSPNFVCAFPMAGRGSVLRRPCDVIHTSGFVDNVTHF